MKEPLLLLVLFITTLVYCSAQSDITKGESFICGTQHFYPEFPGGEAALRDFIKTNLIYPDSARNNNIEGKVWAQITIDSTGCVTNAKLKKGIGYCCDEEVLRVLELMPQWKPGGIQNRKLAFDFIVPIKFTLKD